MSCVKEGGIQSLETMKAKLQPQLKSYLFWFVDGTSPQKMSQPSTGIMACAKSFVLLFSVLCTLKGSAVAYNLTAITLDGHASCYKIQPGILAGIISADVLLTLVLVIITYQCARIQLSKSRKHREKQDQKTYMNFRASKKT
ncbi:hematopoietic cell signal transducer isoform 2-T2 [Syngnathus typhle]